MSVEQIKQAVRGAEDAMLGLLGTFERHIGLLSSETDAGEIRRLNAAVHALRDSAGIYLTWARQYAKLVDREGDAGEAKAAMQDFMEEDNKDFQNPIFG